MNKIHFLVLLSFFYLNLFSQVQIQLGFYQPAELVANAGNDQNLISGNSVTIGSLSTASGGTPDYSYLWQPGNGLNDPTLSNPVAYPGQNTLYILTVIDSYGCTASDSVIVSVIDGMNDLEEYRFEIFPNPASNYIELVADHIIELEKLKICDIFGNSLRVEALSVGNNCLAIDVSNFKCGIYFLSLNESSQKFIVY